MQLVLLYEITLDVTKTRKAEGDLRNVHGKQKGEGGTTQRMGNKVTDRAGAHKLLPFFNFPFPCSFSVPYSSF